MSRTRERAIGASDLSPLVLVDEVDEKIVVKGSQSSIEVLTTEQQKLFTARRADQRG